MTNVVGVWSVCAGLFVAVWGVFGSLRWSAVVAGLLLTVMAAALLVDVGDDS